ncbi:UDP-N-acetylmuramoyl-L-alanyl-D-glutamate--2,6-diaminopimelate ligase [Litoribacillus peritrichatus]|uniref:UDP-N-acetylmuramoyl-L-alanyl-D-glutamate--2,6-diaminopimelate ligase n=1 Tax=Litoribacillus peritrichatus TaxID=718191 RepID=A0ABP7LZR9_9GAMM
MQVRTVKLRDCLEWLASSEIADVVVDGITLDSRTITGGELFVAVQGLQVDGRQFVTQAIEKGARAVFRQADQQGIHKVGSSWIVDVPGLEQQLSGLAAKFYGRPSEAMTLVGVTGTNGKTTVSQLVAQAFHLLDKPSAVIGTAGNGVWPALEVASHTTPDPISLQKLISDFKSEGAELVAMEVSSHGLDQGRVSEVAFDVAVFTNLTRDHLDYHGSMDAYGEAKSQLFKKPGIKASVINLDDVFGEKLLKTLSNTISYSVLNPTADVYCRSYQLSTDGINLSVASPWGDVTLKCPLIGLFNVSNVLAVVSVLGALNVALADVARVVADFQSVSGRMELLGDENTPSVIVDYAHTGDALEKALIAIKEHCSGQLYCVFGCGGDRDRGKRAEMAEIAERLADVVVATNDNPRTENPEQIMKDIVSGFKTPAEIKIELDREQAINWAVQQARPDDWILVAGKGHEDYQEIDGVKHPFSDVLKAKAALAEYVSK